ncbi:prolyl-tRNA synthetase [Ardenticatena maritima]|uniref:Proline--tRNA ligase n=1 Tax=Ardenticatena maritima TaxID=872965 RepID=A0A0M9UCX6_9CHLR|nr:proline--tRNA ligase [Ardenticatena maritima]KPL88434.1 proline--tRNA ligase [Ardenticatena maritima]GAP63418.1 prolyl-tRNA synthetase [Ardenticatena maritima]
MAEGVTPRSEDYSRWYQDIIREAELADYGPVRGTMVIRPYGYAIWENIQKALDRRFKATGHQNAYFPMFIPYSFIEKEKEHVEGFSPELALVTIGGGKELEEPLVVRPTSETIINYMFAKWVQSYRDLPLLINQWANVVRWEMRTRPFLRTLEFLWQEGHTAHATYEEAEEEALRMIEIYRDFAENEGAVPVVVGRKSRLERFAGALHTYTMEAMMGDKKALQAGTSHNLGQNFAKAFGIQFLDENNELQYAWQTSWGVSTRFVGAVIMVHGDDQGLRLPPRLAPIQVVIVPIWRKEQERESVEQSAQRVREQLENAGIRVHLDDREEHTPGWKFNFWEMKGVPVRIEIGPRDVAKGAFVLARRDIPGKEGKTFDHPIEEAASRVQALLDEIQRNLLEQARAFRDANIHDVRTYDELREVIAAGGWARGYWAGSDDDERRVKEETGATLRCFPFEQPGEPGVCFMTGQEATEVAIFAKAY